MNVLFFKISTSGPTSPSAPIGENPQFELTDVYSDKAALDDSGSSGIQMYQYNEETKELLVWDNPTLNIPA